MECEKCNSENLVVLNTETGLRVNVHTHEQYEETTIYFKCNDCGCEFTELV